LLIFLKHTKFLKSEKNNLYKYLYPVNSIKIIADTYIAACIGTSFKVWNKEDGARIYDSENAHDQAACDIISLYGGDKLVTCGGDALIRVWSCDPPLRNEKRAKKNRKTTPSKLGIMRAHGNHIQQLVKINEHSFASIGKDNLVIFWRDGSKEQEERDIQARDCLVRYNKQYEKNKESAIPISNS